MKTNSLFIAVVLATAVFAGGAVAQTDNQAPAPAAPSAALVPTPNEVIYLPRLPEPTELTNAAAAQGITVQQIAQTSAQVTVVYKYADGQTHTTAYQLLPVASNAPMTTIAAAPTVAGAPTTVVYATPAPVYVTPGYYYYDPFYDPWPWFGPVSFRVGLGYGFHNFGGGFRHFGGGSGFRHFGGGGGFHHR